MADFDAQNPFTAFNFSVEIQLPGADPSRPLCTGSFAECDGLEIAFDIKTIREGGNNSRQIRFAGPVTLGTLSLKRGMTPGFDLWRWVVAVQQDPGLRAEAVVVMFGSPEGTEADAAADAPTDGRSKPRTAVARFALSRCLPVKIKAPALNAKDGLVAVEELQVAYEALELDLSAGKAG
jgi:phage tail-like protein